MKLMALHEQNLYKYKKKNEQKVLTLTPFEAVLFILETFPKFGVKKVGSNFTRFFFTELLKDLLKVNGVCTHQCTVRV